MQRKVAGAAEVLHGGGEIAAMGLMGLGGLIAVAGGLLFVVLAFEAVLRRPARAAPGSGSMP